MRTETEVSFIVEGDAELAATDNGNLCGNISYGDRSVPLYRGSASAVIRLKTGTGQANIRAMAEGLETAEVVLRFGAD